MQMAVIIIMSATVHAYMPAWCASWQT